MKITSKEVSNGGKKIHSYSLICHMDSLESKRQDRIQCSGDLLDSGLEISFCGTAGKEK